MELNLFFLAPLLQCKFIDRCALFMRAKKKIYFILPQRLNILFHSLSHSTPLYLSQSLSSHPFPRLSQSLKLSSSLTVTLSISLIHDCRPNLVVPSRRSPHRHSPLSSSLFQAPSFTAACLTQLSQAIDRLIPTPPITLDPRRRPTPSVVLTRRLCVYL